MAHSERTQNYYSLEEAGLQCKVIPINKWKGDQFAPAFLEIRPNNRMPGIVDPDGPGSDGHRHGQLVEYLRSEAIQATFIIEANYWSE